QYRAQVGAAFSSAIAQAQALIAQWIAGTLAVTAAVLAGMIAALIQAALLAVLTALWTAAWDAAVRAAGGNPAKTRAQLEAFLATQGANWASLISGTGIAALLAAITAALRAGSVAAVMHQLADILGVDVRSEQIAVSEVTRAWNAAILALTRLAGTYVRWQTKNDSRVCPGCMANQQAGPVLAGQMFPSATASPPLHPRCRCVLLPSRPPAAAKVLRREVGLNGQETWSEYGDDPDFSGGRVFQPHLSDGTQIPGASVGTEPPRWDGSEPFPVTEYAPDADDSAAYGQAAGIGSRPAVNWPAPYMDGYWPSGGHGMQQPERSSPGARNGRPPNAAGKAARAAEFLKGAPQAKASAVRRQMLENFPPEALGWVGRIRWAGPVGVPYELMDTAGKDKWAASHEQDHVARIAADLKAGKHVNPVIGVIRKGHNHIRLIDGRHRTEAHHSLGQPVTCYVGYIDAATEKPAYDTYHSQFHSGDSPRNKSFTAGNLADGSAHGLVPFNLQGAPTEQDRFAQRVMDRLHDESSLPGAPFGRPYCAGLVVRAADTGRLLMLQRAVSEHDDGAGLLEWPGGHAEEGESLLRGAMREWSEEVGLPVPAGQVTGHWESSNGVYAAFVLTIPREAGLDLNAPRQVTNPDGDKFERAIFIDPGHLGGNQAVRQEVLTDLPLLLHALSAQKSAETPVVSTQHHPLGHEGLWHTPDRHVSTVQQLPAYFQNTARALMRDHGMGEQEAIATAVNAVREWSEGHAFGGKVKVTPEVQEAASAALAEWERLKESHH
ncbi:MAG TPA: NUDIX domain-containing protein, partial [Streptosporangiaceae bacterium]|nr:NUDIX domain-containing protein [Streptosporangiaceae bacterium]